MKKIVQRPGLTWPLVLFLSGILSGCNKKEDFSKTIDNNPVEVRLTTDILNIQSRVTGTSFDKKDEIGVFLLEQPKSLLEERHADNVRFVCSESGWQPDAPLYYPKGNGKSDFIAYYPYHSDGVTAGMSAIPFTVETDQYIDTNYSRSDFLVSVVKDIQPSEEPVLLNFKHKLTALELILDPGTAYGSVQQLLDASPVIVIKNVCTLVNYDFISDNYNTPSGKKDIVPAGEFSIKDGKLVGKKAIIVPQVIPAGEIFMELQVEGRRFNFTLGEEHIYAPATKEKCVLTLKAAQPNIPGEITTSASDWETEKSQPGELIENESEAEKDCYEGTLPDFSESSVYKVMHGEMQVAEICREYLKTTDIDNQAVVVYPVSNGVPDLSKGTVLQVLDANAGKPLDNSIHGGSISWDADHNSFVYTKGEISPITKFYIESNGSIKNTNEGKAAVITSLKPALLQDSRGSEVYPVVKVGTQYWMGENLRATYFTDGIVIPEKKENAVWKTASVAFCYYKETREILYKSGVMQGKIAPEGWRVPLMKDWSLLIEYLGGEAILVEDSSWEINHSRLNLTGLSVSKTGFRQSTGTYSNFTAFWYAAGGCIYLDGELKTMQDITSGYGIRCIRE